jgi:hypothetical protein
VFAASQVRLRLLGKPNKVICVPDSGVEHLISRLQSLDSVLAQCLKHSVPHYRSAVLLRDHHRLAYQSIEKIKNANDLDVVIVAHRFGGFQSPPASEHSKSVEDYPLLLRRRSATSSLSRSMISSRKSMCASCWATRKH